MPTPRLPGLPTVAALMLTATIVAIVSITGAPKVPYEVLKDFQPSIAAFVALSAAAAAYFAAMARVALDREIDERQRAKERIGLYLRLISQLRRLQRVTYFIADSVDDRMQRAKENKVGHVEWTADIFMLDEDFDEIEKAWQNLELLPEDAFGRIDRVRLLLASIKGVGEGNKTASEVEYTVARTYHAQCERLLGECPPLIGIIKGALNRLKWID
jgi:membrane protein implicated in regulation of membrane protease activity